MTARGNNRQKENPVIRMKRFDKKGISVLVSHAAFLAIGVVALIIISAMIWSVYDSIVREEVKKDLTKISQTIGNEIAKLYLLKDSPAVPEINKSLLLGESSLELQQKAGGRQYVVELEQSSGITITNISESNSTKYGTQIIAYTANPFVQVNYTLYNIGGIQGFGSGGKTLVFRYHRINYNGTIEDRIALNSGLVIAGESIR